MSYERLRPVQYDEQGQRNAYRPKFPWKKALASSAVVALLLGGYFWRQKVRADQARAELRGMHAEHVSPVLNALGTLRARAEEMARSAQDGASQRFVDPNLRFSDLHTGGAQDSQPVILYARVRATALRESDSIRAALETVPHDGIGACLGLTMTPTAELYRVPEVLRDTWLTESEETNDMMRLGIRFVQLETALGEPLGRLRRLAEARYLLMTVIQGQDRQKHPVDLFMWDLQTDALVLRSRTEARGRLISARSQIGNAGSRPGAEERPMAAADCSIAAHLKAITGEPVE